MSMARSAMAGNRKIAKKVSLQDAVVALLRRDSDNLNQIANNLDQNPRTQTLYNWVNRGKKGSLPKLEIVAAYYGYEFTIRKGR